MNFEKSRKLLFSKSAEHLKFFVTLVNSLFRESLRKVIHGSFVPGSINRTSIPNFAKSPPGPIKCFITHVKSMYSTSFERR